MRKEKRSWSEEGKKEKFKFYEVYTQTHTHTDRCIYTITTLMTEASITRLIIE